MDCQENFEKELQKHSDEAASKVDAVLARAEEQGCMIESLHTSVSLLQGFKLRHGVLAYGWFDFLQGQM